MRTSYQPQIRHELLACHDGMSVNELASKLRADSNSVRRALRSMPDAYIDRWVVDGTKPTAVWCAVDVPEDCPPPKKVRKK